VFARWGWKLQPQPMSAVFVSQSAAQLQNRA